MNYLKDNNNTFLVNNYFWCLLVEGLDSDYSHERITICYALNIWYKRTRRNMLTMQMKWIGENKISYNYAVDFINNKIISKCY